MPQHTLGHTWGHNHKLTSKNTPKHKNYTNCQQCRHPIYTQELQNYYTIACMGPPQGRGRNCETNIYACSCRQKGEVGHMIDRCIMRWFWHLTTSLLCSCKWQLGFKCCNLGCKCADWDVPVSVSISNDSYCHRAAWAQG